MITFIDTCTMCSCVVELADMPLYSGDTTCALCEVNLLALLPELPLDLGYEYPDLYDPDNYLER
jgi:hypothetical protein